MVVARQMFKGAKLLKYATALSQTLLWGTPVDLLGFRYCN